jgi:hypothetical protein
MARYDCSDIDQRNKRKCGKPAEGFAKVNGKDYLICKKHANSNGYTFIPFTEEQAIKAGLKKAPAKQEKPTSIFKSDSKKKRKK